MSLSDTQLVISLGMTIGIYVPFIRRIIRRKHTRDYSRTSYWFITSVQVNNLGLAVVQHNDYFIVWYVIQALLCGTQLVLIYKYWNYPEPRHREVSNVVSAR